MAWYLLLTHACITILWDIYTIAEKSFTICVTLTSASQLSLLFENLPVANYAPWKQ